MKLLGNVLNRLLVTSAKFEECSRSRKSYVKFSILGLFFWHTRYMLVIGGIRHSSQLFFRIVTYLDLLELEVKYTKRVGLNHCNTSNASPGIISDMFRANVKPQRQAFSTIPFDLSIPIYSCLSLAIISLLLLKKRKMLL